MKGSDDLTGLPARGAFMERFAEEAARAEREGRPLCLLVIDVDHLKTFNDHYGHLIGDAALRAVADVLRETLRAEDLPGRYGGDEFVALLPGTGLAEGLAAAKRVRAAAAATAIPLPAGAATLRLSLSIGVACLPDDGVDPQTLFAVADRGAYAAKAAGRNAVRHAPGPGDAEAPEPLLSPPAAGRMVGRTAELTRLGHLLAAMLRTPTAGGGMALVEGEAGIGKSRLLLEFTTLATALGVRVLSAPCHRNERGAPYHPFLATLAPLLADAPFEVVQAAGPFAGQIARLLPAIAELLPRAGAPPPGTPEEERARTLDAMAHLMVRLVDGGTGAQPTILILDGLHWADEESIRLLYRLACAAVGTPLLLIGTLCPEEAALPDGSPANPVLQDALAELERLGLLRQRIALAPLTPGEMRTLLHAAGGATLGAAARRRLIAAGGGNPLFLLENLRAMQRERSSRPAPSIPTGAQPAPPALAAILTARLSGLDQADRTVLAAVALLARPVDTSFLAAALDPAALPAILSRLSRLRLLVPLGGDTTLCTLVYPQVGTLVLEELGPQRRAMLRRHLARTVVATGTPHAATAPSASTGGPPAVLTARLLGGCTITHDGRPCAQRDLADPDAWTLLLALLVTPGHCLPDAIACAILCPESDVPPRGRLARLVRDVARLAPGCAPLVVRRAGQITLRQGLTLRIDVEQFQIAATRAVASGDPAALHAAHVLYTGPLLPALAGASWAARRREEIDALHQRLTERAAAQPIGTVTLLHVSTGDAAAHRGEDLGSAMQRDARIAAILARYHGYPADQQDADGSRCAVFTDPAGALSAAVAVAQALGDGQPDPPGAGIPAAAAHAVSGARIALYTGEVEVQAGTYEGITRYRCAKLCELAHPGQILAGHATYAALGSPPDGARLQSLGSHLLPGTRHVEEVYQALHRSLPAAFPPLSDAAHRQATNLSPALTTFVGRRREMAAVAALLRTHPLVTLTGAGGAGKTRLALEVAGSQIGAHADGVWIVELAGIQQPALIPPTIAGVLGLEDASSATPETLVASLGAKRLLLVLDNCEHLIDACAEVATALLRACPRLTILATSREPLDVAGESLYAVPPLSVPDSQAPPDLPRLARYEAVALFLERAQARRYGFALTPDNAPHIVHICARLDGIPLAIELAAARVSTLTVEEIAGGLDACFEMLSAGPRSALPRHRTLRAALDWSYALLDDRCQTLLRRLAVFVGGWDLDAARAVCPGDGLPAGQIAAALDDLAGKSLLTFDGDRYHLLEITRHYGRDHLSAAGELATLRDRHLAWCVALAERTDHELSGPAQAASLAMLEREHDNFRAALSWSIGDTAANDDMADERRLAGLRLATALEWFWSVRNYWSEGRQWLEQALAANPGAPPAVRARALVRAGALAERQLDFARGKALIEEGLTLLRALDDRPGMAGALRILGNMAFWQKEYDEATARYQESLDLQRDLDDRRGMAGALNNLGLIAKRFADYERAIDLFSQALAICRELGHRWGIAAALDNLGFTAQLQGNAARAIELHRQSLDLWRELGDDWSVAAEYTNLGYAIHGSGDHLEALNHFAQALAGLQALGDLQQIAQTLDGMAYCAAALGQLRRAVEIHAATTSLCDRAGITQLFVDDEAHPVRLARLRAALGEDAYAEAWAAGCTLTLDAACAQALRIQPEAVAGAVGAPA